MANLTITNVDVGSVILKDGQFNDELLTFAGASTVLAGTILARDTTTNKLVPYVKGGVVQGNGIANSIVTYPVTAAGAGDESVRSMVAGSVRQEKLVIAADGDASNVDYIEVDFLRDMKITVVPVDELNIADNQ